MALSDASSATNSQDMPVVRHHIERGDTATGADGAIVGTVEQLVMDRGTGQPSAIVVRSQDASTIFELPWKHIVDTSGNQVRLNVAGRDMASVAKPYHPEQYVPVDTGQTVAASQASTIAKTEGHPVVTTIQSDAVDLVEPKTTADDATKPYPSVSQSHLKRTAPLSTEPIPPTQPLAGRRTREIAEQGEIKTEAERDTLKPAPNPPEIETSRLSSTEGELVGGRPSTSGMGESSTVPTPGTERDNEGLDAPASTPDNLAASSARTAPVTSESTYAPPVQNGSPAPAASAAMAPATGTGVSQFSGKVQQIASTVQQRATQAAQSAQVGTLQARQTVAERWNKPLTLGLAAAGLSTGTIIGVIASIQQRRNRPGYKLSRASKEANKHASSTVTKAQDALGSLLDQTQPAVQHTADEISKKVQTAGTRAQMKAAQTSRRTKRAAKRAARRGRWFRNGLLLGSALALLFAPQPGEQLRAEISSRVEAWRSKIA